MAVTDNLKAEACIRPDRFDIIPVHKKMNAFISAHSKNIHGMLQHFSRNSRVLITQCHSQPGQFAGWTQIFVPTIQFFDIFIFVNPHTTEVACFLMLKSLMNQKLKLRFRRIGLHFHHTAWTQQFFGASSKNAA